MAVELFAAHPELPIGLPCWEKGGREMHISSCFSMRSSSTLRLGLHSSTIRPLRRLEGQGLHDAQSATFILLCTLTR
jgi:hypothetical protein